MEATDSYSWRCTVQQNSWFAGISSLQFTKWILHSLKILSYSKILVIIQYYYSNTLHARGYINQLSLHYSVYTAWFIADGKSSQSISQSLSMIGWLLNTQRLTTSHASSYHQHESCTCFAPWPLLMGLWLVSLKLTPQTGLWSNQVIYIQILPNKYHKRMIWTLLHTTATKLIKPLTRRSSSKTE